ncbi:hypothetical protein Tco_1025069 [Tanacetum coccineum]
MSPATTPSHLTTNPVTTIALITSLSSRSLSLSRHRPTTPVTTNEYKDNGRFWGSKSGCNESDVKPYWKDIKKAKACMLAKAQASDASSKAKVEARGSKAKLQASTKTLIIKIHVRIKIVYLGLQMLKPGMLLKARPLE